MRLVSLFACLGLWVITGCAGKKPAVATQSPTAVLEQQTASLMATVTNSQNFIVTPSSAIKGKIALVNPNARYVVLTFPLGTLPPLETRLNVYRDGLKVGEVKVTGPQMDNNTVSDITVGEARTGDEVRDN